MNGLEAWLGNIGRHKSNTVKGRKREGRKEGRKRKGWKEGRNKEKKRIEKKSPDPHEVIQSYLLTMFQTGSFLSS